MLAARLRMHLLSTNLGTVFVQAPKGNLLALNVQCIIPIPACARFHLPEKLALRWTDICNW
jgi:hypothetical protein